MKSNLNQFNITYLWRYLLLLAFIMSSSAGYSQDLTKAKQLCQDLTTANKAMAKQAGYDLDALCSEVSYSGSPSKAFVPALKQEARGTVSSTEIISFDKTPAESHTLKPFGYDLFANAPTTFAPAASIAVSEGYILGSGDTLDILFYGKDNSTFSLEINREGFVDFPKLGPVGLSGLSYGEAKEMLQARISAQIIGTQVSISMGSLRSMQVFVLGEAFKPGAYTLSSLSTMTHALISSGGISNIGSLRNIQLKRSGKTINTLDLYDLLLSGDTSKDFRIQEGDVIYIPTVGDQVSIDGQVLRPAIYEIKGGESAQDLVNLAGGLSSKAFPSSSRLKRINDDGFMTVLNLNMEKMTDKSTRLMGGDHLIIDEVTNFTKNIITLDGAVRHKGELSWHDGMRVSDVIDNVNKLDHDADLDVAILVRELENSADIEILTFDLGDVLSNPTEGEDIKLQSRDKIIVFFDYQDRAEVLSKYVNNIKRQASIDGMARVVTANGKVRFPGEYPLTEDMTVYDLINLSGGLLESAYSQSAEISRLDLSDPDLAVSSIVVSNLNSSSNTSLMPSDHIHFRTIPEYREDRIIQLEGEFVFPGTYVFGKGETLSSVILRAGGFTDEAFVGGSVFLRESLKKREQEEIDRLIDMLNEEISGEQLRVSNSGLEFNEKNFETQKSAVASLKNLVATGRLVIPLIDIMSNQAEDVYLKDGDRLIIPKINQEVTIIGEVRRPTSYLFNPDSGPIDFIEQSGGFKESADEDGIFIVKADGAIILPEKGLFKFSSPRSSISPGDTIVVPLDTDETEIRGIPLLSEVSQIIYQLSLGAAAVNSLKNN